jgi:hypothetical protein
VYKRPTAAASASPGGAPRGCGTAQATLPGDLERQLEDFITHYNTRRYHESLNNLTPESVFTGQGSVILQTRNRIKETTMELRKQLHVERRAAYHQPKGARTPPYFLRSVSRMI